MDEDRNTLQQAAGEASRGPNVLWDTGRAGTHARALDGRGWYCSGDLCRMDEDDLYLPGAKGYYYTWRVKISAVARWNILFLPRIHDACVVANDERLGERSCA